MEKTEAHGAMSADLVSALAAAQGEFGAIVKGKTAGAGKFTYRYADLAEVLTAVRPSLSKNGLAVIQRPTAEIAEDGTQVVSVETILAHKSGASISSDLSLPVNSLEIQSVGSALTYLRRYSLLALLGVSPEGEDDDGQQAKPRLEAPKERGPAPASDRSSATSNQLRLVWAKARDRAKELLEDGDEEEEGRMAGEIVRCAISPLESTRELRRSQVDDVVKKIATLESAQVPKS